MSNTEELGHGSSPAAWIAITVMLAGIAIGTLFLVLDVIPVVWAASVLLPIGLILGFVLKRLGFGAGGARTRGN